MIGVLASIAVHVAFSFWPVEPDTKPEDRPLQATLTELPPPPMPEAPPKPPPKPRRPVAKPSPVAAPPAAPEPIDVPAPETVASEPSPTEPTVEGMAMGPELPAETAATEPESPPPELPKTLPRRVDLVYKAFLGTQGFLIGEAVYRFEHANNEYQITTIGEAKGLAALFIRGQGKIESRGLITARGLKTQEFAVERGSKDKREIATFDWEAGIVTLFEQKTEALTASTFDPLTLMWQAYFTPPVSDTQEISIATTRRVVHYTVVRDGAEKLAWNGGEIMTERWHRKSDDGKLDATIWLSPELRYVPVKMRVTGTRLGTLEAQLDSIRVDEPVARQ